LSAISVATFGSVVHRKCVQPIQPFAKFRVRGGTFEAVEGKARDCNIVIEFKDYETALTCYRSPEYTKARALRAGAADIDIIVIEGYDGPQPTD